MRILRTANVAVLALGVSVSALAKPGVPLIDVVRSGDVAATRALLETADVDARAADGATALHWAVHEQRLAIVELLLDAGADVTATNRYGVNAASLAAENGTAAILERLLDAGVDPATTMPGGETLLMTAARTGDTDTVRVLLARGADPNARESRRGQTALMWAAANNNAAIAERLSLSPKTVSNHISNIYNKLQVADRLEAYQRARAAGMGTETG